MRLFQEGSLTSSGVARIILSIFLIAFVGVALVLVLILLGVAKLLDYSLIVSLVVVEVPLALFLAFILGEHRRAKRSELIDLMELAEKYKHLKLHYWEVIRPRMGWRMIDYYLVENTASQVAYDCPTYLASMSKEGIINKVKHNDEKAAREALSRDGITLKEREPSFAELQDS